MKSLKEMSFKEVEQLYWDNFGLLLGKSDFQSISKNYEKKTTKFLCWTRDKKLQIKGVPFGRNSESYGLTIIYGWFLEKLFSYVFQKNQEVKLISFFGDDSQHEMKILNNKIEICGIKTTLPDFEVTLKNGIIFFVELKSGVKEKFTVKEGNVNSLIDSSIRRKKSTILMFLDLKNKKYEFKGFDYFVNETPKLNRSMENQFCYDFPSPERKIETIAKISLVDYFKNETYKNSEKYKKIKIKINSEGTPYEKLTKKKFKLEEELEKTKKIYEDKILKLRKETKNINWSWEFIENKMKKNQ